MSFDDDVIITHDLSGFSQNTFFQSKVKEINSTIP